MKRSKKFFIVLLFSCAAMAQTNVNLVGSLNQYPSQGYNDIWGYVDGNGIEYALLGCGHGTSIVRLDNPLNPVEAAFIPGPSSIWRDIKVHGNYAYIITEGTGSGQGLQIVDLSQLPITATLVNTISTWFSSAHNIFIDNGYAFVIGTNTNGGGMHIIDLSDPVNPTRASVYTSSNYIHDIYVWNDTVIAAAEDSYDLVDITNKTNPQLISVSAQLPGIYAHSGWMTEDKRYFIGAEEFNMRDLTVWDLQDRTSWDLIVPNWQMSGDSPIHNIFILGDYAHISYYKEGYVVLNIFDPANPVFAGQYDTYSGGGTYEGAWGCYPYFPSGLTIISDISTGLYVLRFIPTDAFPTINHSPASQVFDSAPVTISADILDNNQITDANLHYRTTANGTTSGWNIITDINGPTGNTYEFIIPGQIFGTIVEYYLAAQDDSSNVTTLPDGGGGINPPGSTPPPTFFQYFVASLDVAFYDEANNTNDWTVSGGWNITSSKFVSPPTSFTDSPTGNYPNNNTAELRYNNQIDLTGVMGASLEFDTQWSIEDNWDYAQVEISTNNGFTWIALEGVYTNPGTGSFQPNGEPLYDGAQLSWVHEIIDISSYVDQNINLRFMLKTDVSVTEDGWYVDNIKVTLFTTGGTTFSLSVAIADGWNVVSIPGLHPTDQDVLTWWSGKDPAAAVFKFNGTYSAVTTAATGEGYWMKHLGANLYDTGDEWPAINIVTHDPIPGNAGWNLIGGYENIATPSLITTNPPGLVDGPIFGFSGGYLVATTLEPGFAYWIKLTAAGDIIIPSSLLSKSGAEPIEYFKEDWGRIIITDNAGRSFVLYAVTDDANLPAGQAGLDSYEMPPAPPEGSFDIRFSSNRIAEDINTAMQTIELSRGVEYPIVVKVENMDIRIQDESGRLLNEVIESGQQITIHNQLSKLLVTGEVIPDEYALEQNYPNPFNPSTVIEFSLPENVSNVRLTIYNALGERVAELVNTTLEAGRYSYKWDAANAATGMYIYELRTNSSTGGFVSVKKMLMIK